MRVTHSVLAVLCVCAIPACALAQTPAYSVQVVPQLPVRPSDTLMNSACVGVLPDGRFVVGNYYNNFAGVDYFIGGEGGWTPLPLAAGFTWATASRVTDSGSIYGTLIDPDWTSVTVLWRDGQVIDLTAQVGTDVSLNEINRWGAISGVRRSPDGDWTDAVVWRGGTLETLPTPDGAPGAMAVQTNGFGMSVGITLGSNREPVLWMNGVPQILPTPSGVRWDTWMSDVNDSGWAVGHLWYANGPTGAYLWRNGAFELIHAGGDINSVSISENGDVLVPDFENTVLWRNGVEYHADELLTPGFGGELTWLTGLLDDGRVLAEARINGVDRHVLLTPIPSPGTFVLVLSGVLALAKRRRLAS